MSLIKCEELSYSYDGIEAVKDVNLKIDLGDYLCILGENGAGKSTLIKGILNLKKPSGGVIEFSKDFKPNEVGYLPQQTIVQKDFPATVWEVVLSGCLNSMGLKPFYTKKEKDMARHRMEELNILHLKNKCYRELSGGQQQRVLLARALCSTKKLLILDEPASGLDPVVTRELYELIHEINRNLGITVIVVTHDVIFAMKHAKHILHLQRKQLFWGTLEEYKASNIGRLFLEGETKDV